MRESLLTVTLLSTSLIAPTLVVNNNAPIVQPGGVGAAPKSLSSDEATKLADNRYSLFPVSTYGTN